MEATRWLFEMISLLEAYGFKLSSFLIMFLYDMWDRKKVLFLSHFIAKYDVMMTSPLDYDKIK